MTDTNNPERERIARVIAFWHGSKMVLRRDGETWTVAALAGYGKWGDSAEKYAAAQWQNYDAAADAVLELVREKEAEPVAEFNEENLIAATVEIRNCPPSPDDLLKIVRQVAGFDGRHVTMLEMVAVVGQAVAILKHVDFSTEGLRVKGYIGTVITTTGNEPGDGVALTSIKHPVQTSDADAFTNVASWEPDPTTGSVDLSEPVSPGERETLQAWFLTRNPASRVVETGNEEETEAERVNREISALYAERQPLMVKSAAISKRIGKLQARRRELEAEEQS